MARKKKKSAKRTAAKKSKKKTVAKKTKKTKTKARRAAPAKRAKTKTKRAKAKPKAKAKKKTAKRAAKRDTGEGNYAATRAFDKAQVTFVKKNRKKIPAMAKEAEKALDGPEGAELEAAESEARAHGLGIAGDL